jgi:hypothetical protein
MSGSMFSVARREERIFVSLPVTLRTGWKGCMVAQASTVDLSEHGVRVRAKVPFRLGQDVELKRSTDSDTQAKRYRVVWVRDTTPGQSTYDAGLELRR